MLSGDNSILQKATEAKTNTDNSQIQERINLAYHSALTSGLGEVEEDTLKNEIKKEFNKNDSELDEENWLDKTSVAGKWKITIDGVSLEVPAGATVETPSIINYGGKTAQTVGQGDDITIDTYMFKVIKKENNKIIAISYNNLASCISFAFNLTSQSSCPELDWGAGEDINMNNSDINIQQYITEFQESLNSLGATNVTARIARYQEMYDLTGNTSSTNLRNPSQSGYFWLGTSDSSDAKKIYYIGADRKHKQSKLLGRPRTCTVCDL